MSRCYLRCFWVLCCWLPALLGRAQQGQLLHTAYIPSLKSGTVAAYLEDIHKQTGIQLSYGSSVVDLSRKVSIDKDDTDVQAALKSILVGQRVDVLERNGSILLTPTIILNYDTRLPVLNGSIREKRSGEVLIGATIYVPDAKVGTVTNSYGYYTLPLFRGSHRVIVSYIGYETDTFFLVMTGDTRHDAELEPVNTLAEVRVTSRTQTEASGEHVQLIPAAYTNKPQALGEEDPMRSLQLLPGVQAGINGSSSVMVRGGDPGQNLYLLDGVPLYYVDHFFGLTSVYNGDAVKSVDFYKGAFPSRYGGRLSSIIDVNSRDGDMQRFGGNASLGMIKASLNLEGPIVKDKASFMVSARRSWIDGLLSPFSPNFNAYFYDINAKANWIINKNNRVYAGFYTGRDQIQVPTEGTLFFNANDTIYMRARWGNTIASARWNSIISPRLFLNTTATFSMFRYSLLDRSQRIDSNGLSNLGDYQGTSSILDAALHVQAQWLPVQGHRVEMGLRYANSGFTPTALQQLNSVNQFPISTVSSSFRSHELTAYMEDQIRLGDKWILRPGLHWANWLSGRFQYSSLQPRLYVAYRPTHWQTVYASATRMGQFLHLLNNNTYGLPTDFWVPSTADIRPEDSRMVSLGWKAKRYGFDWNVEGYYKDVDGVIAYTTGKNIFDNSDNWQDKITQGRSWSYGMEFSQQKNFGKFSTALAYTLSWNWQQFDVLNGGQKFPYRYDRRHNIRANVSYHPSKRFEAVAQWMYASGEAFTIPDQLYPDLDRNLYIGGYSSTSYTYNYAAWNAYRLPAVHRLDWSVNFIKQRRKHYERTWSLGVYNTYNRPNVDFVTLEEENDGTIRLKGINVLPLMPYFSLKIKF